MICSLHKITIWHLKKIDFKPLAVKKILFLEWECNVTHYINNKNGNSGEI